MNNAAPHHPFVLCLEVHLADVALLQIADHYRCRRRTEFNQK